MRHDHAVGVELALDARDGAFLHGRLEVVAADDHGDGVDAARDVLVAHALLLEDGEQTAREADLAVHQILVDDDVREAARGGDAGHGARHHAARLHDHRARLAGVVRVAHVDRDARLHGGKDRLVVEHAETGVGEFAHLAVGHRVDAGLHLGHEAGVDGVDAVHVGEVLVHVGAHGRREDGTRDVAAAARERGHGAVHAVAEEARIHDNPLEVGEGAREALVRIQVERGVARLALENHARVLRGGVARLLAALLERDGHELRVVVLARRLQEVHEAAGVAAVLRNLCEARLEVVPDGLHDLVAEVEALGDLRVARDDGVQRGGRVLAVKGILGQRDQKVGDLRIVLVALAGGRNHHDAPLGIGQHDIDNLGQLACVRKRAATEFAHFHFLVPLGRTGIDSIP